MMLLGMIKASTGRIYQIIRYLSILALPVLLCASLIVPLEDKVDFNNYKPLLSQGPLPTVFTKYAKLEVQKQIIPTEAESEIKAKKIEKKVEEFELKSSYSYNSLLAGGRLLYGDPITGYLNKVAGVIFKNHPDVLKNLTFYTFKSSSANAFCLSKGTICLNIGLIANLNSEAELAFVLAHEAAHYVRHHGFNTYIETYKVSEGKGDYSKLSYEEMVDLTYAFSKDDELEADAYSFDLFAETDYHPDALESVFKVMNYFYLPYTEAPFDKTFFNIDNLVVPQSFFKDSLSPIAPVRDYNERWDTHPNTVMRLDQIEEVLDGRAKGDKLFIVSEEEFKYIRKLARFECIRLELLRREYGSAIYLAQLLMKEYPNNEYLETSVAKALYGLAKYKNADEYHMAARPYMKAEGESQQIHYLLRKFNLKQLNTVAIKYITKVYEKYPERTLLKEMRTDLFRDLVVTCELKPEHFTQAGEKASTNDRFFYKLAFQDELKDEEFKKEFSVHYPDLEEEKRKEERTYKEVMKEERVEEKNLVKDGLKLFAKKLIIVDPVYLVYDRDGFNYELSGEKKLLLDGHIRQAARENNLKVEFLSLASLNMGNTADYNTMSRFKEWVQEKDSHGQIELISLVSDHTEELSVLYGTNLVYFPSVAYVRATKTSYLAMYLYNLESGKIEYTHEVVRPGIISMPSIRDLIHSDFDLIVR